MRHYELKNKKYVMSILDGNRWEIHGCVSHKTGPFQTPSLTLSLISIKKK